jgi:hypothetical protein
MTQVYRLTTVCRTHGLVFALDKRLLQFMDDLFVDVLMYILEIPSPLKTSAYLDGSVESFLPQGQ